MMRNSISIRNYHPHDARALVDIYYHTIHQINKRDYTPEQLNAWAPATSLELERWQKKWTKLIPLVAVSQEKIVGFAEFEMNGHIDCFYCHHEWIRQGVGSALMHAIEEKANAENIKRLFAEVSITAKPFFLKKNFQLVKEQTILLNGVELTNFIMEKYL